MPRRIRGQRVRRCRRSALEMGRRQQRSGRLRSRSALVRRSDRYVQDDTRTRRGIRRLPRTERSTPWRPARLSRTPRGRMDRLRRTERRRVALRPSRWRLDQSERSGGRAHRRCGGPSRLARPLRRWSPAPGRPGVSAAPHRRRLDALSRHQRRRVAVRSHQELVEERHRGAVTRPGHRHERSAGLDRVVR